LIDNQSGKLKRYGQVNPALESVLDPALGQLAQLALDLASVFDDQTAENK
jgi:hypothetical protein